MVVGLLFKVLYMTCFPSKKSVYFVAILVMYHSGLVV